MGNFFLGLLLLAVYFLPSVIADLRHHSSLGGIAILNLFLGWTLLGWLIALIWACSGEHRPRGKSAEEDADEDEMRRCPYCAETIKRQAIVCKHCGRDIAPLPSIGGSRVAWPEL